EEEELGGGVATFLAAPDADEEEERNQRELEKDVEQDDIAGDENTEAAKFEQEEHRVEERRAVVDGFPAYEHRSDDEQCAQAEEPDAEAIESDAEADIDRSARGGEPGGVGDSKIRGRDAACRKAGDELGSTEEGEQCDDEGGEAGDILAGGGGEADGEGADQ